MIKIKVYNVASGSNITLDTKLPSFQVTDATPESSVSSNSVE